MAQRYLAESRLSPMVARSSSAASALGERVSPSGSAAMRGSVGGARDEGGAADEGSGGCHRTINGGIHLIQGAVEVQRQGSPRIPQAPRCLLSVFCFQSLI